RRYQRQFWLARVIAVNRALRHQFFDNNVNGIDPVTLPSRLSMSDDPDKEECFAATARFIKAGRYILTQRGGNKPSARQRRIHATKLSAESTHSEKPALRIFTVLAMTFLLAPSAKSASAADSPR